MVDRLDDNQDYAVSIGISDTLGINHRVLELLKNKKYIQLPSWEKITIDEINKQIKNACDFIVNKYGFNNVEAKNFKKGIILYPFQSVPGHPDYRWISCSKIKNNEDSASTICEIYVNPNMVSNSDFYFAVLFHELDHHAFFCKKFNSSQINKIPSKEERQNAINLLNQETNSEAYDFSTELIARVDTADELMSRWIPWNKLWAYWPGNEHETSWEAFYRDSILYAKKFLWFQIWLYNLLGKEFWFDATKNRNQQLSNQANIHFQQIMTGLRNYIMESKSIDSCKLLIDNCYEKLISSNNWRTFYSKLT